MDSITVKAYAKINVGLRILKKRLDGYHNIETIFHRVNIFDELTFEKSEIIKFTCTDPSLTVVDSNLCIKAIKLLQERYKYQHGVRIILAKNIPIGGGLGGGSSDAAATLLGVSRLWNIDAKDEELAQMALQLGSDVSFFLKDENAYATKRGELLDPVPFSLPYWIVVVFPGIHVSTGWAYTHIKQRRQEGPFGLNHILKEHLSNLPMLSTKLINDFEPLVTRRHPQIGRLIESLKFWGAGFAQLSGSGSCVYGLFSSKANAEKFVEKVGGEYKTFITPPHFKPEP
ncbi:MAG: 4-(cytidine 5'-diphospho)-2-C-methyl-D-erythritol kinase [Bacteroidota bacterium]